MLHFGLGLGASLGVVLLAGRLLLLGLLHLYRGELRSITFDEPRHILDCLVKGISGINPVVFRYEAGTAINHAVLDTVHNALP